MPSRTRTRDSRSFSIQPVVFFFLAGLVVFAPVLFGGRAYFDGDLIAQYVPMRVFLRDSVLQGHLPLWCPYLLGGQPFFADPNTQSAYPLTYLVLPFPAPLGFSIFFFLHFVIDAWGMFFWVRSLGASSRSGIAAGLLTVLGGFFWWEIIHPPLLAAFAWMPWWAGALERLSQKMEPRWGFGAGLAFAFIFLSGNYQMTLGAAYGGGIYFLYRVFTRRDWRVNPNSDRNLLLSILCFLWGALPLLALWIPSWEFLRSSGRFHETTEYLTFQADLSLAPGDLGGLIFPVRSFEPSGGAKPIADYLVNAGYLGPWAFFFMALGLRKKKGFLLFMGSLGLLALLTALGKFFPLHYFLCRLVPGFDLVRAPFRFLFLYLLAGIVLVTFGLEELEKGSGKGWRIGALFFGGVVLALGIWAGWDAWPSILSALVGMGGFYFLSPKGSGPGWAKGLVWAALILPVLPTPWLWSSSRSGPVSNFDYLQKAPVLSRLKEKAGLGRVLVGDHIPYPVQTGGVTVVTELPPDSAYVARVRNAIGYNPLGLESVSDLYTLGLATNMKLRAVRSYAAGDPKWKIKGFRQAQKEGLIWGDYQDDIRFVYSPMKVVTIPDKGQRLAFMASKDYDPYRTAVISEPFPAAYRQEPPCLISASLDKEGPDFQSFQVTLKSPGWVVFSETNFPGWKAWVDRTPSAIFTANHAFRALWMKAGEHEVEFRYEPAWVGPIVAGLVLWVLSLGLWCWPFFRKWIGPV